ncbi:MAG: DedA family protein [Candidatus Nanoarchaeia archaeon]
MDVTVIISIIERIGYLGLFLLSAGESCLLPIPSEVILPFAGYLVYKGVMNFWLAFLIALFGQIFGSILAYFLGFYGGRVFVLKYGKYFLVSKKRFEKIERWFQNYGHLSVFFGKLLPVIRTIIALPAGVMKMSFWKFLIYSFGGSLPWTLAFIYFGFVLGPTWDLIFKLIKNLKYAILIGIFLFLIYWIYKYRNENKTNS